MQNGIEDAINRYDRHEIINELTVPKIDIEKEMYNITDFYIGIFLNFMELIESVSENRKIDILKYKNLGRVLQKIAILTDKGIYRGIDTNDSLLYSASIYYLLGYKANAFLITKLIDNESINDGASIFIKKYLENNVQNNKTLKTIRTCFVNNDIDSLNQIVKKIERFIESNCDSPNKFIKYKIIQALVLHLMNNNIWNILNMSSVSDKKKWEGYLEYYTTKKVRYDLSRFQRLIVEKSFSSSMSSMINFLSQGEKNETINLLIFNHLHSNIKNEILYVVPEEYEIDNVFSNIFKDEYIYCNSEEELSISQARLFIVPIRIFSNMESFNSDKFTLIIFDSFVKIGNPNEGIKYEYAIGKVMNECDSDTEIKFVDNDVFDFPCKKRAFISNNEDYIDSNRLINCYIDVKDKEITVEIDRKNHNEVIKDVFLKKTKYYNENGEKKNFSISKTHSRKSISCKIAIQLLQKGNKINLFTPQLYHPTLGVYELADELHTILESSGEGLLTYKSGLNYVIKLYEENFGSGHLFSKLIRYGIVVFYAGLPIVVKDLLRYILDKEEVILVISNSSISRLEQFSKFDTMVIHMLRFNAEFNTKPKQNVSNKYWRDMDYEEIRTILRRLLNDGTNNNKYIYIHNPKDIVIFKKAVENIKICKLKSGFEELLSRIDMHKDLVENIESIFEGIDYTILDMLIKEVDVVGSSNRYFYSINDNNREKILGILSSRKDKLSINYNKNDMRKIKSIGGNSSLYNTFSKVIDKNKERLLKIGITEFITELIFEVLEEHEETKLRITEINNNKFIGFDLDFDTIKKIILKWIGGKEYCEICLSFSHLKMKMEELLFLINYFIDGYICRVIPALLLYLKNEEISLLYPIEKYEISLSAFKYGCSKKMPILLYKIGLRDRFAVNKLTEYLISIGIKFNSEFELLEYLNKNINNIDDHFNNSYFIEYIKEIIN